MVIVVIHHLSYSTIVPGLPRWADLKLVPTLKVRLFFEITSLATKMPGE
jgi:hypothetical protein